MHEIADQLLLRDKGSQVCVLRGVARDQQPSRPGSLEGIGPSNTEDEAEADRDEPVLEPGKVVRLLVDAKLIGLGGDVKAVYDPGVVPLKFKESHPGLIRFEREGFFGWIEVDEAASPGEVGEGAPLGRDKGRVVPIFARTDNPRMLIQREGYIGLERETSALKDDFGTQSATHKLPGAGSRPALRISLSERNGRAVTR